MNVFFETQGLTGLTTMRAKGITVVRGVEDICIIELAGFFKPVNDVLHYLVNSLQRPKSSTEELIEISLLSRVKLGELLHPGNTRRLIRVPVLSSFNLLDREKPGMSRVTGGNVGNKFMQVNLVFMVEPGMTSDGSDGKIERLVFLESIFKVVDCLLVDEIRRVFTGVDLDRTVVS